MSIKMPSKCIDDQIDISDTELVSKLESSHSDLSFKAIGILFFLKNKHKGWSFHEKDLYGRFDDGKTAVRGGIKELKNHGIITEEPYQIAGRKQGKKWILTL